MKSTASGREPSNPPDSSVPTSERLSDGQYADHWVLTAEERSKGFVRPLRKAYKHVGLQLRGGTVRDLTEEEKEQYAKYQYVKFEEYQEGEAATGRYWTQERWDQIDKGCGVVTIMGLSIAETYARDPYFYGSTFCTGCRDYLPLEEFVWEDGGERVGS